MNVFFMVVAIIFLFSCEPATYDRVISSYVTFTTKASYTTLHKKYKFTQKSFHDSLYILRYFHETENPSDSSKTYTHAYTFEFVPARPCARQQLTYNDAAGSPLWLLDSMTYQVDGEAYTVFKYAAGVYADNYCIRASVYLWSPDFGIILWDYVPGMMHQNPTYLTLPASKKDSTTVARIVNNIQSDADILLYRQTAKTSTDAPTIQLCDGIRPQVDQPEVISNLRSFVDSTLMYPQEAHNSCIYGNAHVELKLDTVGNIVAKKVWIAESQFLEYTEAFKNECLRVIESIPDLAPLTFQGRKVPTQYSLPFNFELPNPQSCEEILAQRQKEREAQALDEVFVVSEQMPEFPGGEQALHEYITSELIYPEQARKHKVSGDVFVRFMIDKDGSTKEIEILETFESNYQDEFTAEAIRLVKNMPKWNPGKVRGRPVKVRYPLRVRFEP